MGGELAAARLVSARPLFSSTRTDSGAEARLVAMDPVSGDLKTSGLFGSNTIGKAVMTVSDYDQDGTDEVFFGSSSIFGNGYATVYDFFAGETESAVQEAAKPTSRRDQGGPHRRREGRHDHDHRRRYGVCA